MSAEIDENSILYFREKLFEAIKERDEPLVTKRLTQYRLILDAQVIFEIAKHYPEYLKGETVPLMKSSSMTVEKPKLPEFPPNKFHRC